MNHSSARTNNSQMQLQSISQPRSQMFSSSAQSNSLHVQASQTRFHLSRPTSKTQENRYRSQIQQQQHTNEVFFWKHLQQKGIQVPQSSCRALSNMEDQQRNQPFN